MPSVRLARPRIVLLAVLAGVATIALGACGSTGPSEDNGPAGSRTITDAMGSKVKVPNNPRRVVALSEPTLDGALALGLRPLATTGGRGQGGVASYLARQARGVVTVGPHGRPDLEHVAALKPDLILADAAAIQDRAVIGQLRDLAPTVYVSKAGQDWRTAFRAEAAALNRQKEGAHVLNEFDSRVAEVRAALGDNAGARVSVVRWGEVGLPSVLMDGPAVGRVLKDLGLTRPPSQDAAGAGDPVPIGDLEDLKRIDGDWMFLGAGSGAAGAPADLKAAREAIRDARATPGFGRLKAARQDHVVPVDGSAWAGAGGPIAERIVVDDVARALGADAASR